jgi:hypothetical protein
MWCGVSAVGKTCSAGQDGLAKEIVDLGWSEQLDLDIFTSQI